MADPIWKLLALFNFLASSIWTSPRTACWITRARLGVLSWPTEAACSRVIPCPKGPCRYPRRPRIAARPGRRGEVSRESLPCKEVGRWIGFHFYQIQFYCFLSCKFVTTLSCHGFLFFLSQSLKFSTFLSWNNKFVKLQRCAYFISNVSHWTFIWNLCHN